MIMTIHLSKSRSDWRLDCSILIKNVAHNVIIQYGWHHFIKISYQFYEKKISFFFALFGIKNII